MSSKNSESQPKPLPLAPNDEVLTPSGRKGEVLAVYADTEEALVQWSTGDRARFKLGVLVRVPPKEEER